MNKNTQRKRTPKDNEQEVSPSLAFLGKAALVILAILLWYGLKPVKSVTASLDNKSPVHAGPGLGYEIIGYMEAGSAFTVKGRYGIEWVVFDFNGQQGWMEASIPNYDGSWVRLDQVNYVPVQGTSALSAATSFPTTALKTKTPVPTVALASPEIRLQCKDTFYYAGSWVTCKISHAYCSYQPATNGSPTFCNDAPYPTHNFALVVWGDDWSDLDGRCILVSGSVSTYNGKPQIEAVNRSQVEFCN